ncbi:hypothetical protein FOZ63_021613, partial [Perkinsus olseni]
ERSGVLIVDQWIETGHTMCAAIQLFRASGLHVAAAVTVAAETPGRRLVQEALGEGTVITALDGPGVQQEVDDHFMEGFKALPGSRGVSCLPARLTMSRSLQQDYEESGVATEPERPPSDALSMSSWE